MSDIEVVEPLAQTMQATAEAHLGACMDHLYESDGVEAPWTEPFCGCVTCIVREVLAASWDLMCVAAEMEIGGVHERQHEQHVEAKVNGVLAALAQRLRHEADVARSSDRGQHPAIRIMTQAAALRYAADVVEGKA